MADDELDAVYQHFGETYSITFTNEEFRSAVFYHLSWVRKGVSLAEYLSVLVIEADEYGNAHLDLDDMRRIADRAKYEVRQANSLQSRLDSEGVALLDRQPTQHERVHNTLGEVVREIGPLLQDDELELLLLLVHGKSHAQIAELLSTEQNKVRARKSQLFKKIKKLIDRVGLEI